jgi:hypothetical protein
MGLLDDAIREHLELKRRRGADPTEVAREQREALDPVPGRAARAERDVAQGEPHEEGPLPGDEMLASGQDEQSGAVYEQTAAAVTGTAPIDADASESSVRGEEPGNMEETAELDMKAVLEDEALPESERYSQEDALESEVQEQIAHEQVAGPHEARAPAEERSGSQAREVLEEEEEEDLVGEVPEQERLQFEQGSSRHPEAGR